MHTKRLISGLGITGLIRGIFLGIDRLIGSSVLVLIFCVLFRVLPLLPDDLQTGWFAYGRTSTLVVGLVMIVQSLLMNDWGMVFFWSMIQIVTRYCSALHSHKKSSRLLMRGKKTLQNEEIVTLGSIIIAIGGLLSANTASIPGANLVMMSLVGWLISMGWYGLQPHYGLGDIVRRIPFLLRSGIVVFSVLASLMTRYAHYFPLHKQSSPPPVHYIVLPGANPLLIPSISGGGFTLE